MAVFSPSPGHPAFSPGGIWLDGSGKRLGGEVTVDGRPCDGVAVDLTTGLCETVLSLSKTSNDRLGRLQRQSPGCW